MKKTIKILFGVIVVLLVLIVLFMFRKSFASFSAKITGKSTTDVAEPIFIMDTTDKKVLNDSNTEVDYYFTIKNFNENNERSQSDLKYQIEIYPTLDSSIVLTLYRDNNIVPLNNQKTDYIDLQQSNNQTHLYRLNIKYDRERINSTIDIRENIYIKASAIQS